jgi:hypothetical protein
MRPFPGPSVDDYKRQHLFQEPPPLLGVPAPLASLIARCLRKDPAKRPSAARVLTLLESGLGSPPAPVARHAPLASWENVPTLPFVM